MTITAQLFSWLWQESLANGRLHFIRNFYKLHIGQLYFVEVCHLFASQAFLLYGTYKCNKSMGLYSLLSIKVFSMVYLYVCMEIGIPFLAMKYVIVVT